MDSTKLEKLKSLVQVSSILESGEKEEWLGLLPLMNDKQSLELEKILSPHVETLRPVSAVFPQAGVGQSLSHISNLPNAIIPVKPSFQPLPPVKPNATASMSDYKEKALSPPVQPNKVELVKMEVPGSPEPVRVVSVPKLQKQTLTVFPEHVRPGPIQTPVVPVAHVTPAIQPHPVVAQAEALVSNSPVQFSVEDLAVMTVGRFKTSDPSQFLWTFVQMIKRSDYFSVRFALEKSPLYQNYVYIGRTILEGKQDFEQIYKDITGQGKECMTHAEFETFTDILSGIQVN